MAAQTSSGLIPIDQVDIAGGGLNRPECVLCTSDGSRYTSDWRGGVCKTAADGVQTLFLPNESRDILMPNGIALMQDGSFLLANLGETGGVWRLFRNGDLEPFITEISGAALPPANFVMIDRLGRVWITVSTRKTPRALGYRKDVADGFIVLVDTNGARIVADGLGYTNEALFDEQMEWLYVNETFARRLSRFRVGTGGVLTDRQTVIEFGPEIFPDGLGFDESGGVWVVSIVSNRVLRITPDGECETIIDDSDAEHVEQVEVAYQNGTMNRPHLDTVRSHKLRNISSIAFGGTERRTAWLGCLLGDSLACFNSPWAGIEPVHWNWND